MATDDTAAPGLDPTTVPATSAASDPSVADPRRWWALAVVAAATLMVVLDASIVNIAIPQAQADLQISDTSRQWVVTAYTLTFGGLLLLGGRTADYLGRKRMFLVGLVGFAAASALGGFAVNAAMLFGARALQGVFAALLAPAALSLVTVAFSDPGERAKAFGVYGAVQGGGGALGLILGGLLTEYVSWRWCLFVNIPIAVAAVLAAGPTVRESRAERRGRYDLPGALLSTIGLVALVYGFTQAADTGWTQFATLACLTVGLVLLLGFVVVEARTAQPLLPLRVILDRDRGGSFLASLLLGAGMFGILLFLSYYLQLNLGYRPLQAGLAFLPFSGGIILTAALASTLLPRYGPKPLMVTGMAIATLGLAWLTRLDPSSTYPIGVLPAMIVMSISLGLVFVPLSSLALTGIRPGDAGVASALLNTTQQIGGALGVALLNTLYVAAATRYTTSHPTSPTGDPTERLASYLAGYQIAFLVGTGLFAAALIVIICCIQGAPQQTKPDRSPHRGPDTTPQRGAPHA